MLCFLVILADDVRGEYRKALDALLMSLRVFLDDGGLLPVGVVLLHAPWILLIAQGYIQGAGCV